MTKMAIDLGTTTGFAWRPQGILVYGHWSLKPGKFDGAGMRLVKLMTALDSAKNQFPITHIGFEAVRRHLGTDAAHVYGGLMGVLQLWCERNAVPYEGVPVAEIKKSWTGKGNSDKAAMMAEAARRGFVTADDNEADALALLHLMEGR